MTTVAEAGVSTDDVTQLIDKRAYGFMVKPAKVKRERVPGLRFPKLPSNALLAQLGGAAAGIVGVFVQFGTGWAMIVGGAAAVVTGMLHEAGKI